MFKKKKKKSVLLISILHTYLYAKSTQNNDTNVHTTIDNRSFYFFPSEKDPVDFHSKHKEEKEKNKEKRRKRRKIRERSLTSNNEGILLTRLILFPPVEGW